VAHDPRLVVTPEPFRSRTSNGCSQYAASGEWVRGEVRPVQGGRAGVDGWAAGAAGTGQLGLVRVVWSVTAALLLGVALLTVALVGQGVATASELQATPGDATDSRVLPAAETPGDGVATDQVAGPDASGTGDDVDHDFTNATAAATVLLAQPLTPAPEGSEPPGPPESQRRTVQPESWGKAYRPEDSQDVRQERVEDAGAQPDDQREGAPSRGVDIMLAPNEVYLAIGGTDTPGAPYAHTIPATAARTLSVTPQPPSSDPATEPPGGLAGDLDAPEGAGTWFGSLGPDPHNDRGVVQLPPGTVTAEPTTHPDQGQRTRLTALTAAATRGAPQAATTGARFDPAGPQPPPTLAIPTGPSTPAHDAFLPRLPQATIALAAAPIGAGSPATVTQAASGAPSGVQPDRPAQPGTVRLVLAVGDGATTSGLPAGDVRIRPASSQSPLDTDRTPLVALLPAGAAPLLAADVHTGQILQAGIAGWDGQGWEYLVAAGLLIGGLAVVASAIAATGVAVGALMLGYGLVAAGTTVVFDKYVFGEVGWRRVAAWGVLGGVLGGLSYGLVSGLFYSLRLVLGWTALWRWLIPGLGKPDGPGGSTISTRLPGWWPRYQVTVYNYEQPGTVDWWEAAAHEGVHALLSKYAGPIKWLGGLMLGPIPVGAPIRYAEEVVAYSIGHLAVGRLHLVPVTPIEAFWSLTWGEIITTLVMGGAGAGVYSATQSKQPDDRPRTPPADDRRRRLEDCCKGTVR